MRTRNALLSALSLAIVAVAGGASAEQNTFPVPNGGGDFTVSLKNFKDMRFNDVVRQRLDFSCGSAALATLLTYHYGMPVDESSILTDMYENGEKEKIHKEGFSLLDMKNYLASLGLNAEGYKESLNKLSRVGIPAIVLINRNGYMHFVVVKGVTKDKVLIGDPAIGLMVYNRSEFEAMWNNILFVITDMKEVARSNFNNKAAWAKRKQTFDSEIGSATDTLANFTLSIANTGNYY